MDIGTEEEQPVQYPIPVDPRERKAPRREEVPATDPVTTPAEEPVPA